jgi:hypothetical protein
VPGIWCSVSSDFIVPAAMVCCVGCFVDVKACATWPELASPASVEVEHQIATISHKDILSHLLNLISLHLLLGMLALA